ncbi:MAG: TIGR02757 family protein [Crocinitomicaceae bacterium]|jgi:uncharacterized protein (TIGR02757 family)|nr:TIGR02757 family protein [Crocinitomicaceae bacterium]MDG2463580.1 TIGR02757 family protein [Crocinitomicaceae bacterium]
MDYSFNSYSFNELKEFLDSKVEEFNNHDFLPEDPLGIVHEFTLKQDREIMGILLSTIAWGNRKSILKSGRRLIDIFGGNPFGFIQNHTEKDFENVHFVHRTFQVSDLQFFCQGLQEIYKKYSSLESVFKPHDEYTGAKGRIVNFRETMLTFPHEKRSEKHLANPLKKSASKRINMFLRWMVREDDKQIDFGIWKSIPMNELMIPLDVHTSTVGRKLGLITRKQDDWSALEELMVNLRKFDDKDPCKYDFALFGLGVSKTN